MHYCLHDMPSKRRLVTSEICFGTEKAGHLDFSYNKCALASACCHLYNSRARSIQELVLLKCLYIKSLRYFLYQLQKVVILLASISLVSKFQAFHLFKFKIKRRFFNFKEPITNLKEVKQSRQRNKADSFLMRIICPIVKCTWQKKLTTYLLMVILYCKIEVELFFQCCGEEKKAWHHCQRWGIICWISSIC